MRSKSAIAALLIVSAVALPFTARAASKDLDFIKALTLQDYLATCQNGMRSWDPNNPSAEDVVTATSLTSCYSTFYATLSTIFTLDAENKTTTLCYDRFDAKQMFNAFLSTAQKMAAADKDILNNNAIAVVIAALKHDYPCPTT